MGGVVANAIYYIEQNIVAGLLISEFQTLPPDRLKWMNAVSPSPPLAHTMYWFVLEGSISASHASPGSEMSLMIAELLQP